MHKFKAIIRDILFVSRLTKIPRKKLRILFSAIVSNGIGFSDIFIILSFSKFLSDTEIGNEFLDTITSSPKVIPFVVIIRYTLNFIGKYNVYSLTKDIENSLKTYILDEVYKKGNYSLSDATYYIEQLSSHIAYFFNSAANITTSLIQIILFTSFLTYDNYEVMLLLILLVVLLFFPSRYLLKKTRDAVEESFKYAHKHASYIQRIIDNIFLVKILNTHKKELIKFEDNLYNFYRTEKRKFVLNDINVTIPNFIAVMSFSILLIIPRFTNAISLEFLGVTLRLVQSLSSVNSALGGLIGSHVHLEKLIDIKNNNPDFDFEFKIVPDDKNAITLKNLHFSFLGSSDNFYENLNISFEKHKHHIITGDNGSGKSTLLGLLTGALKPYKGEGYILSNKIGYIGATPLILDDTLRENLLYACNDKVADKKLLDLLDEFKVFNEGNDQVLDMQITNKTLSSGQMQKISFIRAFVSECEILFLDESTSNLDVDSKELITKILKEKRITIINSTHSPEDFEFDTHHRIFIKSGLTRSIEKINNV